MSCAVLILAFSVSGCDDTGSSSKSQDALLDADSSLGDTGELEDTGDVLTPDTVEDDDEVDDAIDSDAISPELDADDADATELEPDELSCVDPCPAPHGGLEWGCERRFMYGINYAWHHFAGDFGGIAPWGQRGVAENAETHANNLAEMRSHGVSVVRWWVWPDFRGDGVRFDGEELPVGLGETTLADLERALELAEENDVYLMLCLFSFDNFRPSREVAGIWTPGIAPMVMDAARREALLENVVRPFARAAQASPYHERLIAWDVINEPEWAMSGASLYGDPGFDAMTELEPVSHAEMERFLADTITVLREESDALITVGGAAAKWAKAWTGLDLDFYQFHMYAWINIWWPYTDPPSTYGLDRPIVMGEFPLGALTSGASYGKVVSTWYDNGYAGALGWMYGEASADELDEVASFAAEHPCETRF
jgi:hypothetical protein